VSEEEVLEVKVSEEGIDALTLMVVERTEHPR
jgi:hypothetical protein